MILRSVSSINRRSESCGWTSPFFMTHSQPITVDRPWRVVAGGARIRAMHRPVPPHAYFAGSAVFHYLGPSFAVLLFARVDVLGVAWLRIASAALVFAAWRRPRRSWARLRPPQLPPPALRRLALAATDCHFHAAI